MTAAGVATRVLHGALFVAGIIAMVLTFALCCEASAQQPNTDRASLRYLNAGPGGASVGQVPAWGAPAAAPGPHVYQVPANAISSLWVYGAAGEAFEIWGHSGPPSGQGVAGIGGTCDLDFNASWSLVWGWSLSGTPGDQAQGLYGFSAAVPASPSTTTLQAWVADPTRADGVRLTACLSLWN